MFSFKLVTPEIAQYRTFDHIITFYENPSKKIEARVQNLFNNTDRQVFVTLPSFGKVSISSLKQPNTPKRQIRSLLKDHYHPISGKETLTFSCISPSKTPAFLPIIDHVISVLQIKIAATCSVPIPPLLEGKSCNENSKLTNMYSQIGEIHLENGELEEALKAYKNALNYTQNITAYEPIPEIYLRKEQPLHATLAYLYLAKAQFPNQPAEALKTIDKIFPLSSFPELQELRAISYLHNNENEKAFNLFYALAKNCYGQKKVQEALGFYEKALLCDPSSDFAAKIFRKLIKLYDNLLKKENTYIRRILHFASLELHFLSYIFYREARKTFPDSPFVIFAFLSTLLSDHLDRYEAYRSLADLYKNAGQFLQYTAVLQKLIRFKKDKDFEELSKQLTDQPKSLEELFITWIDHTAAQKNYPRAEEITQAALTKLPQNFSLLQRLYDITQNLHDPQKQMHAASQRGQFHEARNQLSEAEKFYREAFQIQKTCQTTCQLADLFFKQGRRKKSIRLYFNESFNSFNQNDFATTALYYQNALKLDPNLSSLSQTKKILFEMLFQQSVTPQALTQQAFSTSNPELSFLFSKILSDLKGELSSMPDGKEFLEDLQERMNEPIIICEKAKQMLEWIRDKNFIIFCEALCDVLKRSALNRLIGDNTKKNLLEKAKNARTWILDEKNQSSLLRVTELVLQRKKLTELPPEIGKLTALQWLDLEYNHLTFLPLEIGKLTALQEGLCLDNNSLTALFPEIGQLTALKSLSVEYNQLTFLSPEIGKLTALQKLWLSDNQLTSFPLEIGKLTALQMLDLNDNKLTSLSPEIGKLTALRKLYLNNNQLTFLPLEIGKLTALQAFLLYNNRLSALPTEIGQLTALQKLDLKKNQLTSLPTEIGQLMALQELYLGDNQLTSLPPEIRQLTTLQKLDLQKNKLVSLPAEISKLTVLQELWLWNNKLTSLPRQIGKLTALQKLWLSDNQLTSLPQEIGQLIALEKLDLRKNQLISLLPEIGKLTALQNLYLRDNQLASLPTQIGQLTAPQCFFLNNPLTSLPNNTDLLPPSWREIPLKFLHR